MIIASNELKREQGKKGASNFCRKFGGDREDAPGERLKLPKRGRLCILRVAPIKQATGI
jgi:hypothetical protein